MRVPLVSVALLLHASQLFGAVFYLTIAGLGGEQEYEQRFAAMARDMDNILKGSGGEVHVFTLHGKQATKQGIQNAFDEIAAKAKAEDAFVLTLIGHGSFDGVQYKFNIPGPDLTAEQLAALCNRIPARRQLVVNTTSASGGSIEAFQKDGRVVIAATRSGTQKNATVFSRYWVEALRDAAADTDKNQTISALEAFRYADAKTAGFFETQKRLATEHAVLEDTGKGQAVRSPSPDNGQGLLAASFPLLRIGEVQKAAQDPAKRGLLAKKESLEQAIDKLKYEKAALPYDQYRKQLATLLLELAKVQEELER
jgi:hypothetical protein